MTDILVKRDDQEPFKIPKNQVVPAIKSGKLLPDDEISVDGKSWIVLSRHKQLGPLFNPDETAPPPKPKPKVLSETVFYSSERVQCPKCGFEQKRGETCESCNLLFKKFWEAHKTRSQKKTQKSFAAELDGEESGNFVHKLWNGKYPLWKAFWIYTVALPFCVILLVEALWMWQMSGTMEEGLQTMMQQSMTSEELPPEEQVAAMTTAMMAWFEQIKPYFMAFAVLILTLCGYAFLSNMGVWRSANDYGGAGIWRVLARVWVVLVFISLPFNVYNTSYDLITGFEDNYDEYEQQARQFQEQMQQMQAFMKQNKQQGR